jgi:hypothetical protein
MVAEVEEALKGVEVEEALKGGEVEVEVLEAEASEVARPKFLESIHIKNGYLS